MDSNKKEIPQAIKDIQLAYHRVFNTEDGKKVLEDMKKNAFFNRSTMSDTDRKCFRNEGAREFMLRVVHILEQTKPEGDKNQ